MPYSCSWSTQRLRSMLELGCNACRQFTVSRLMHMHDKAATETTDCAVPYTPCGTATYTNGRPRGCCSHCAAAQSVATVRCNLMATGTRWHQ